MASLPRPPNCVPQVVEMPGAVYSPSGGRSVEAPFDVCPLNVGDTWMEPFAGARMEDLREASHPGLHRYSPTRGMPKLVDAIVDKLRDRNAQRCDRDSVLVCMRRSSFDLFQPIWHKSGVGLSNTLLVG